MSELVTVDIQQQSKALQQHRQTTNVTEAIEPVNARISYSRYELKQIRNDVNKNYVKPTPETSYNIRKYRIIKRRKEKIQKRGGGGKGAGKKRHLKQSGVNLTNIIPIRRIIILF